MTFFANSSASVSSSRPDDFQRVEAALRLHEGIRHHLGHLPFPYFAHLRLNQDGTILNVLFTSSEPDGRSWASPAPPSPLAPCGIDGPNGERVLVVDWQSSPLSRLWFSTAEGGRYEIPTEPRCVRGVVLEKNLFRFEGDEIVEVHTPHALWRREGKGGWHPVTVGLRPSKIRPPERRRSRRPWGIDLSLDETQKRVVHMPLDVSLLILGEAGHGKTTVALHRLAHLLRSSSTRLRAAVIVPTHGLEWLLGKMLGELGVRADVFVYERFARRKARRAFRDIPPRESEHARPEVTRLKRDRALEIALREMAEREPGRIDDDYDAKQRRTKAFAKRADLQHVFGDRRLLEKVARACEVPLPSHAIDAVLEHTRVQFTPTSEVEFSYVTDKERLVPVDRLSLDHGTPMHDASSIDIEDYAVLFELDRMRASLRGRDPTPVGRLYDCIVVDEAQEFSPLELKLIGRCLAPGGTWIVAGDAEQQIDEGAHFRSWEQSMEDLGVRDYERVTLEIGYRCPPEVTAFARSLRHEGRARASSNVDVTSFPSLFHLCTWLVEELRKLREKDRTASIVVVCRTPFFAARLHRTLAPALPCRHALDGIAASKPGISITSVEQVKGLEFDYVIVPDASDALYPATPRARKELYVEVTRARWELRLACVGAPTKLVTFAKTEPGGRT